MVSDQKYSEITMLVRKYKKASAKDPGGPKAMRFYNDLRRLVRECVEAERRA